MASGDDDMAMVRNCFENASRGRFDALATIVGDDYVLHPDEVRGLDGLRETVETYRAAIGDMRLSIDQQFAEGDHVATRFTVRGTHRGELMGIPPTGRDVAFSGITISRCRDGRIVEEWELTDTAGLLRQVGVLSEMARS